MPVKIVVDGFGHLLLGEIALILIEFAVGVINIVVVGTQVLNELGQREDEPAHFKTCPICAVWVVLGYELVATAFVGIPVDVDILNAQVFVDGVEITLKGFGYGNERCHNF